MMTEREAALYLAAMIDGEGDIAISHFRAIRVSNTDWDLIEATVECCLALGLKYRVDKTHHKPDKPKWRPGWRVVITGKASFEIVRDVVPLRSRAKAAKVAAAVAMFSKPVITRPEREWLEQKYIDEGMSLKQIAELVGAKAPRTVMRWMSQYQIPTRPAPANFRRGKVTYDG